MVPGQHIRFRLGGHGSAYWYLVSISQDLRTWRPPDVPSEIRAESATISSLAASGSGVFIQPGDGEAVVTLTLGDASTYVQVFTVRPD